MSRSQFTTAYSPRQVFSAGEWNRDPFDRTPTRIKNRLRRGKVTGKALLFCEYVHGWYYGQDRGDINRVGVPLSLTQMARVIGSSKRTALRVLKEVRNKQLLVVEQVDGRTTFSGADPSAPTTRLVVLPGGLDLASSSPHLNARSGTSTPPRDLGRDRPPPRIVPAGSEQRDHDPSRLQVPLEDVDKCPVPSPKERRGFYVRRGSGPSFVERDLPTAILDILDDDRRRPDAGLWWALTSEHEHLVPDELVAWVHDEVKRLWSADWAMEHLRWAIAYGRGHEQRLRRNQEALAVRMALRSREARLRAAERVRAEVVEQLPAGVELAALSRLERVLQECRGAAARRLVDRGQLPDDATRPVEIVDEDGRPLPLDRGGGVTSEIDVLCRDLRDELRTWHEADIAREAREAAEVAAAEAAAAEAMLEGVAESEDELLVQAELVSRSTAATAPSLADAIRGVRRHRTCVARTRSAANGRIEALARLRRALAEARSSIREAPVAPVSVPPDADVSRTVHDPVRTASPPAPARGSPEWHAEIERLRRWCAEREAQARAARKS